MNFVKSLADSINYETKDKPFFKKKKFDGKVGFIKYSDDSGQEIEVYGIFKDGDFLSQSVEDLMEY